MKNLLPERKDYYIQTNNERDPFAACQRTAAAQCLDIIGEVSKIPGPYKQPEDNLDWIANDRKSPFFDDIYMLACRSHGPGGGVPSQVGNILEWADVLCETINKAVGYRAAAYHQFTAEQIAADIDAGLPVMVSLKFPERNIKGHYVSVVGYVDAMPGRYFIVADPYKNTLKNEPDGYCVAYSPADWADHYKGYGLRFFRRG